jgi:hypothetical protein
VIIQTTEPAVPAQTAAPIFRSVESLEPSEPLAVLVRATADPNWKPVVQQLLASWTAMGVAPDCADSTVNAENIRVLDALETLPIVLAAGGERAERGEAIVRTVTPWCGADRRINVLIFFHNSQWRGLNLSVGGTMTGARLYMDILQQTTPRLIPVLNADSQSCNARFPQSGGRLTNTEVTSLTGDVANPTTWSERWTWTACGKDTPVDFVMTVQPDGSTRFAVTVQAGD